MAACEFCGAKGSFDMTEHPARFYKVGRRMQGAMTPRWASAEWSEALKAIVCLKCWKARFYAKAEA